MIEMTPTLPSILFSHFIDSLTIRMPGLPFSKSPSKCGREFVWLEARRSGLGGSHGGGSELLAVRGTTSQGPTLHVLFEVP